MKYILIILIIFNLSIFAQHNFGVKINGGLSKITENLNVTNTKTEKYYFKPSMQFGLFYNFNFKKSLIGTELLFVQIEGQHYKEYYVTDNFGNPTNSLIKDNVWQHISYLGIPIYYGFKIKKINFNCVLISNFNTSLLST